MGDYAIKFRPKGRKAWWFATPAGYGTRKRIHAARFIKKSDAEYTAFKDRLLNHDLEFKVVKL